MITNYFKNYSKIYFHIPILTIWRRPVRVLIPFFMRFSLFSIKKEVYLNHKNAKARPLSSSLKTTAKTCLVISRCINELEKKSSRNSRLEVVLKTGWLKNAFWNPVFKRVPKGRPLKAFHDILWIKTGNFSSVHIHLSTLKAFHDTLWILRPWRSCSAARQWSCEQSRSTRLAEQ